MKVVPRRRRSPGRAALVLMFLALLGLFAYGLYSLVRTVTEVMGQPAGSVSQEHRTRQVSALVLVTLLVGAGIIAFVIGAYLVLRLGRHLLRDRVGGTETQMDDIWSRGRVSQEAQQAADEQLRDLLRDRKNDA